MLKPGLAAFETMRSYNGAILELESHLKRIYESAKSVGIKISPSSDKLKQLILSSLKKSGLKEAIVRISFNPVLDIIVKKPKKYPDQYYKKGVKLSTAVARRSIKGSALEAKTSEYLSSVMARGEAGSDNFEVLFLNEAGLVTEGAVSNIFAVLGNTLITPPEYLGVLGGITRGIIIKLAAALKINFEEKPFTRHDLYNAKEVFITNTGIEIMPVIEIDGRIINSNKPGVITKKLILAFNKRRK